jgi:hypothetical protein
MDFTNLREDEKRKIAMNLSPVDLINLCVTHKAFNKSICESNSFWLQKLEVDYPEEFVVVYEGKKIENPKQIYITRFTEIINKIESYVLKIIDIIYGKVFRKNFSQFLKDYEKKLIKEVYNMYPEIKKLKKETTEEEYFDSKFDIYVKIDEFIPNIALKKEYIGYHDWLVELFEEIDIINSSNEEKLEKYKKLNKLR